MSIDKDLWPYMTYDELKLTAEDVNAPDFGIAVNRHHSVTAHPRATVRVWADDGTVHEVPVRFSDHRSCS